MVSFISSRLPDNFPPEFAEWTLWHVERLIPDRNVPKRIYELCKSLSEIPIIFEISHQTHYISLFIQNAVFAESLMLKDFLTQADKDRLELAQNDYISSNIDIIKYITTVNNIHDRMFLY